MILLTVYGPVHVKSRFIDVQVVQKCRVKSHTLFPTSNVMFFCQRISIGVPGHPTSTPTEAGECLPFSIPLSPPVFPTSDLMGFQWLELHWWVVVVVGPE
jgi:hypothetical protein